MGERQRKTCRQADQREGPGEGTERNGKERPRGRQRDLGYLGPSIHSMHLAVPGDNANGADQWDCLYTK